MKPVVSVIVPNYNHAPFLRERLASIVNQTYQHYEIILLDDCSSDGSVEILQEFSTHPKVSHFVVNEKNSGNPFIQWQRGLALAQADLIWIAESDDLADIHFLETLVNKLLNDSRVGLVYCRSNAIDATGAVMNKPVYHIDETLWQSDFCLTSNDTIANYFFLKNFIPNASGVIFRKRLLIYTRWRPEIFRYVGDWWAWYTITKSVSLAYVHQSLNSHRSHKQTTREKSYSLSYLTETYVLREIILNSSNIDRNNKRIVFNGLAKRLVRSHGIRTLLLTRAGITVCFRLLKIDALLWFRILKIGMSDRYHKTLVFSN